MKPLLVFLLLFSGAVLCQEPSTPLVSARLADLDKLQSFSVNPNAGFDLRPGGRVLGSLYYDTLWLAGSIRFRDSEKTLENLHLRYNLHHQLLEIKKGKEIKVAQPYFLDAFSIRDRSGFDRSFIVLKENGQDTFFELLAEGRYKLLLKHYVRIKEPNYVEEFDTGSRDYHVIPERTFYIQTPEALIEAKDLLKHENDPVLKKHFRKNQLSLKKADDLKQLVTFLNEHTKKGATE